MSSRRCRRLFTGSLLLLAARRSKQTDLPNCKHIHEREREIERNRNHRQQELTKKEKCFVFSLVLLRPRRRPSAPSSSSSSAAAAALRSRLGLDLVQEGPHLPLQGGGVHRPVGASTLAEELVVELEEEALPPLSTRDLSTSSYSGSNRAMFDDTRSAGSGGPVSFAAAFATAAAAAAGAEGEGFFVVGCLVTRKASPSAAIEKAAAAAVRMT
jgi:hypothetical protein